MSEEKKPKIDLKSRLGKKGVPPAGGAVPPPPGGAIPKPAGIPLPAFGLEKKGPQVDASDPYAAIGAGEAPARVEPQAIKIEMSDEVRASQAKAFRKAMVFVVVAGIVGVGLGYVMGDRAASRAEAKAAIAGAGALTTDVKAAAEVVSQLQETIKGALTQVKANKYPEDEVRRLGELNIPFEGATLAGKGLGRFKANLATLLIQYAAGAEAANDQKDKIHRLLSGGKKGLEDYLAQQAAPKVRWGVYITGAPLGPLGTMTPIPEPFLMASTEKTKDKDGKEVAYKWPVDFKINAGGRPADVKRYESGDPTGSVPKLIPIDPASQAAVCPTDVTTSLARELSAMSTVLSGDQTPGREKDGLIQTGEKLLEELAKLTGG